MQKGQDSELLRVKQYRVYAHLFRGKDAQCYRQSYLQGKEPEITPYGFHRAADEGFVIDLARDCADNKLGLLRRLLRKLFSFDVMHAYDNIDRIRKSDIVWTMTEGEAFAVALLFAVRIVKPRPIITSVIWLFENWERTQLSKRLYLSYLLRYFDVIGVHSKNYLEVSAALGLNERTRQIYFGINTDMFRLTAPAIRDFNEPIKILAIGNDKSRDWDTLMTAFANDVRFEITVICWWFPQELVDQCNNLRILRSPTMADFLQNYRLTDLVVIPMKPNAYSGITVALEAVALGKPVLCTRTGGVPTYFAEDEIFFVSANDADQMRNAVLQTSTCGRQERAQKAQGRFIEKDFSTKSLVKQYAEISRILLRTK